MSDTPYQTPNAELIDTKQGGTSSFYVVAPQKFTILFFSTAGIYLVYWFYRNWQQVQLKDNLKIWPIPRAIFSVFFTHSLFLKIQEKIHAQGKSFDWHPKSLATTYVVLSILSQVADRLSMKSIGSPMVDFLGLLILPLTYVPLARAQAAINFCSNDPKGSQNAVITGANMAWIIGGILVWLLIGVGLLAELGLIWLPD